MHEIGRLDEFTFGDSGTNYILIPEGLGRGITDLQVKDGIDGYQPSDPHS